jgi:hypothetical protein
MPLNISGNIVNSAITSTLNYKSVVTRNLILSYDAGALDSYPQTGTSVFDLSTNNNTATLTNGPTFSTDNGGTFVLDGTNDYINAGTINLNRDFTLEIIANMTSTASGFGLFGQGVTNTNVGMHIFYDIGARGMIYGLFSNDNDYGNNYRPTTGEWYHWVFTYNNSSYAKQFYANSILQTPTSSTQNIYSGTGQFNIGATYSDALYPANGKIAVARAYSRVLSSTEITQNFSAQRSRFGM